MHNKRIREKNEKGFSLIEILIALFLSGVVIASVFGVYINQHKNWIVQEQITDSQQNARAAIDELTRQIRMAGYNLPEGLGGLQAFDTNPDTIVINYADADCDAPIEHNMPNTSAELRCDGNDISCFTDGQWAYIFDLVTRTGEFFEITNVQTSSSHIQHNTMTFSKAYDTNAVVLSLTQIKYYIDRTDTLHPNLMMKMPGQDAQVYAENIEDLQFRYTLKNGVVQDAPTLPEDIRGVAITLVGRTSDKDPDFTGNPYRRRTYLSSVNVRNLDI
jgi:prepilin-type N-terminal cleavage/methylation domain-containing protein